MRRILLIGDSISLHYGPYLSNYLSNTAELHTKEGRQLAFSDLDHPVGGNGGDSSMVLEYLREREAREDLDFDLFVFNCGLHDIKRLGDGDCQISEEAYRNNLEQIVEIMKKRKLKTVFITSTPVEDARHNARKQLGFTRYNKDMCRYNQIAMDVMHANNIPVSDLGSFTVGLAKEFDNFYIDHVHFDKEVRKLQAAFIAGGVNTYMKG